MRRWLAVASLVALTGIAAAAREVSLQEALLRAKPAVAIVVAELAIEATVTCGDAKPTPVNLEPLRGMGTGWFVSADGFVVTNAHVVSVAHAPPESARGTGAQRAVRAACLARLLAARGLQPGQRPDVEEQLGREALRFADTSEVRFQPSISVMLANGVRLPATVAKYSLPLAGEAMSGRDLALLRVVASDMPSLPIGDSDALKIGDRIHIVGFPSVVITHELLNASTKVEASITNGTVSGFKQDVANQTVIQTDAPAEWGNSGGPAVDSRGRTIGVVTFASAGPAGQREQVQGFNFVIPAAAVREFLRDTPARPNTPGRFDAAWSAALAGFFTGEHGRAAPALAEANRLLPDLPDVQRIAAENAERIKNPPPRPFPWVLVISSVAVVILAALSGMWLRHWKRNRFRVPPAEVARLLETSPQPPVIIDARDAQTYARSPVRIPNAVHVPPDALDTTPQRLAVTLDRPVVAYCT
jgi:S1-C subfamily serine protease